MKTLNQHIIMKTTIKCSLLVLMLFAATVAWAADVPINITKLVGMTAQSGNPTVVHTTDAANAEVNLFFTLKSGYEAPYVADGTTTISTQSRPSVTTYGYLWTNTSGSTYKLTIYNSSVFWTTSYYLNISIELDLSGGLDIVYDNVGSGDVSGPASALAGSTVNFTAEPASGYEIYSITIYKEDLETEVAHSGSGTEYSFTMPDEAVYVNVVFTAAAANNITFHVPSCVDTPTGGDVSSLPTPSPRVDGYQFVGWTENSSFADGNSQPAGMLTAGTSVSGTHDYYAVYKKVSSGFTMVKNTAITEGDYVISSSYAAHDAATVMTWEVDSKGRMLTNSDELTFTDEGLTCTDEQFIWHISGSAGNWTLYNNYSDYYLSATSGDASSTNGFKMATTMSTSAYTSWTIEQGSGSYTMKNNQRESLSSTPYWLGKNGSYIGFYASKSSFYFFKRTAVSNAYTINPRCDASEYTVTINNPAVGGTATAVATGATWTPYILSNLYGSETVTLTAVPATGYTFTSWTATKKSGGAVTVTSNSFTMPKEDVTVVPTFTPQNYVITYKDQGNVTYSGSNLASLPINHTYGTLTNLVDGVKAGLTFAGWFTDQACTAGNLVNSLGTDHVGNITLYAKWIRLYNYQAWCDKQVEYYVNGSLEFAATANAQNSYNVPTYLPRTGCEDDKVFVGWSATAVNSLQQTEPTILTYDGALNGVSENKILYAVFASRNGGKELNTQSNIINETWSNRALWDGTNKLIIGNYSAWTVDNNITSNPFTSFTVSSTDYYGARIDVKNYAHNFISERMFEDLHSVVVTAHSITGWASQVEVYISSDKSTWTKVGDVQTLKSDKSATTLTFTLDEVGNYYVKINFPKTSLSSSANYYIGVTGITPKQADKTYYLTDYSTNCTRATAPLAITWVDSQSGLLANGTKPANAALGSVLTMPTLQKNNYRFDGWKATIENSEKAEVYTGGEKFLVNHNVTFTAQWTELFSVTDPEYGVTSYKDITVTSLPVTMTVIGSHDITPVVDGLTDATHFAVTVGAGTNNGDDKDFSYTFTYTPDAYGTGSGAATHTATFRFKDAISGAVSEEVTISGRSLPEEFAIAVKHGDSWVALPSNLAGTEGAQSAIVPLTITVDDNTTPTEAIFAPTTAVYKGANRYTPANATALRFTNDGSHYLQVSTAATTYLMWLSATGGTGVQDWQLKSSDFNSYELTIPSNANPTKKMGIYNDTYIGYHGSPNNAQIFFLPITNKYEPRASEVKEWGRNNLIVAPEIVSDIAKAKVRIDDGTLSEFITPTPINVATIAGAKNIQLNTALDFTANENKSLYIEWYNSSNALVGTSTITIPLVLASNNNMYAISTTKVAWEKREVHVLPGVVLTADAGSFASANVAIKQLEVYPGATVNITTGTLKVADINLRGGWTRASGKQYNTPRIYINTAASLEKTRAHIDMDIFDMSEGKHYYPLSVPFATAVSSIDYADSYLAGFSNYGAGGQYIIKEYDGERRANYGPDIDINWKAVSGTATLQPGRGYIMTALAVKGEAVIRIPLTFDNNWTKLGEQGTYSGTTKNQVSVTAYTGTAANTHQRHAGWNMLGVPFMSCYETGTDMYASGALINGKIVLYPATSDPYRYETAVPYVSVPSHNFDEYIQGDITDTDLRPEWSFFVQVGTSGTIEFKTAKQAQESTSPLYAPRRATTTADRVVRTGIILSNGNAEDKTTLIISDRYTADYEIGADLEKMFGSGNKIATYTILDDGTRLVYNALSETEVMSSIPLGYRAPSAEWYRFSLNERYEESDIEHLYLTDHIEGRTVDLMVRDYSFFSLALQSDSRFTLSAVLKKPQVTTGVAGAEWEQDVSVYSGERNIIIRGVPQGADVWIFSADGKLVRRWQNTTQGRLDTHVTADGVYNVRIIKGNNARTISCVVR